MTSVPRVKGIAAVLATLTGAALATTAQSDAHAATSERATPRTVSVRMHVTGCDHCTVQLQHAVTGATRVWSSGTRTIGSDHVVSFTVRRSLTHGMSFVVHAPWEGNTGAVPTMVTRYAGHAVDSRISRDTARHASRAQGCWAGAYTDSVRLSFKIARVRAKTLTGEPTQMPLAWSRHTMASWKPVMKTYHGTLGNQDAFYCTKPKTTKLTFAVPGCAGCEIGVMNGAVRSENVWATDPKVVSAGRVTFRVPRPATRGISATVVAPWEGATGYTTLVAFRYAHHRVGDSVRFKDARSRSKGSPCWGGTSAPVLTVPLTIRKVTVPGNTGPTDGTIAYADVTQAWLKPMLPAGKGVIGSQEVIACQK